MSGKALCLVLLVHFRIFPFTEGFLMENLRDSYRGDDKDYHYLDRKLKQRISSCWFTHKAPLTASNIVLKRHSVKHFGFSLAW